MRLQSSECDVACGKGRRQIDNARLLHRTRGFAAPEDLTTAVCLLPGTELAFSNPVVIGNWLSRRSLGKTAVFRQVDREIPRTHHDALEFPNGETVLLTCLAEYQNATVLQLPVRPETAAEAEAQKRVAYVG